MKIRFIFENKKITIESEYVPKVGDVFWDNDGGGYYEVTGITYSVGGSSLGSVRVMTKKLDESTLMVSNPWR